jgi:hypothetical protein
MWRRAWLCGQLVQESLPAVFVFDFGYVRTSSHILILRRSRQLRVQLRVEGAVQDGESGMLGGLGLM